MARIRSVKPQFWIDEDLAKLPRDARLLYIALWNFADDGGVFEYRLERLKVQIFPYDPIAPDEFKSWFDLLEESGKFIRFSENGSNFGFLQNFPKHQTIKKPSKYRFATPPVPSSTPLEAYQYPTSTPPVPLGSREEEEGIGSKSVGSKEGNSALAAASKTYEDNIGVLTGAIGERLTEMIADYPEGWVVDAIKKATHMEKRSLAYVGGILKGWKRDGRTANRRMDDDGRSYSSDKGEGAAEVDEFEAITHRVRASKD